MRALVRWFRVLALGLAGLAGVATPLWAGDLAGSLAARTHVLLIRHALAPGVGDPPDFVLERCETQRNLDGAGRQQAVRIGQWLRDQGLSQASVFTSPWCRCRNTAELLGLGRVTVEFSLGSFFAEPAQAPVQNQRLQAFISRALREKVKGQALILVTHHVNIRELVGQDIGVGDMVLARVDRNGRVLSYRRFPSP